jgi:hypothetical protein
VRGLVLRRLLMLCLGGACSCACAACQPPSAHLLPPPLRAHPRAGITGFGSAIILLTVWVVCTTIGIDAGAVAAPRSQVAATHPRVAQTSVVARCRQPRRCPALATTQARCSSLW